MLVLDISSNCRPQGSRKAVITSHRCCLLLTAKLGGQLSFLVGSEILIQEFERRTDGRTAAGIREAMEAESRNARFAIQQAKECFQ